MEGEEKRDYYEFGDVGVTDSVVDFVRDVVMHPETWLDFSLTDIDDEEDFDMSDALQEHALAVERLVPRLKSLRMELFLGYMSETCFWKIYFVILHPRLDPYDVPHDAEVLSTRQIIMMNHDRGRRPTHKVWHHVEPSSSPSTPTFASNSSLIIGLHAFEFLTTFNPLLTNYPQLYLYM
ncbi:uncharacterized protein LOC141668423 [Apium graveolens]|uniref:uncharacterized protein LOC141668423 n=1 Tax=Apium graveolens TaxID=4045 RepID=UPI003D797B52